MEATGVARTLDDLEPQSLARGGVEGEVALVAGIGEQVLEPSTPAASIRSAERIDGMKMPS